MHLVQTMAYVGQQPWHGLGNQLTPGQPLEVWQREAGMDWTIEKADVRYVAGSDNVGSASQRALASLARKAVLSLWSYPNVFTDEGRANVRQWRRSSCLTAMFPSGNPQ